MRLDLLIGFGLVIYRVCRFLILDTLIEEPRKRVHRWLVDRPGRAMKLREKLQELLECPFCMGIWVSAATVAVADAFTSVPLPVYTWLATASIALLAWRIIEDK